LNPLLKKLLGLLCIIEGEGLPKTAKRFVDDAFTFFESLADERIIHRPCKHPAWKGLGLRCINFRKKYIVSYLDNTDEIVVCEFALQKLLK
jgi:hypothetical protein